MTLLSWALKYITQTVFRENHWNKFGTEDPYNDVYVIEQRSFLTGTKKVKKLKKPKEIPLGLSDNDAIVLRKVLRRAYHLDMLFNIFGYRIGFSGLIGFIPIIGDIAGVLFSLLLFNTARQVDGGLPFDIQLKFVANIVIDFALGLIPVIGDLVEVLYKANSRNALALEKYLKEKGELASKRELESLSGGGSSISIATGLDSSPHVSKYSSDPSRKDK